MKKIYFYLDDDIRFVPEKVLDAWAPWRLKGKGVFETLCARQGRIFFLKEHMQRLALGLKRLSIIQPMTFEQYQLLSKLILRANQLKNARLRVTVWEKSAIVHVSVIAVAQAPNTQQQFRKGVRAAVASKRMNTKSSSAGLKAISYQPFLYSFLKAKSRGFDEAIILNERKEVAEASRSNLFCFRKGRLMTPFLSSGCLPGVTRKAVIQLAKKAGFPVRECRIFLDDLYTADEVFLTNAVWGIMPLTRIEQIKIGKGRAGSLTSKIRRAYQKYEEKFG